MLDLRTGKEITRRETIKGGLGLAAILAAGKAPAMLLGARGVAFGGSKKYDRQVKCLMASKTQYIDCGFKANKNTWSNVKFSIDSTPAVSTRVFGCWNNYLDRQFVVGWVNNTNSFYFDYGNSLGYSDKIAMIQGGMYEFGNEGPASVLYYNNITIFTKVHTSNNFTTPFNILLLASSGATGNPQLPQCSLSLFSARFWDGGLQNPIAIMIPVVKDGVGYMYDTVNDRIYGNSGTGAFGWEEMDGTIVNPT